MPFLPYIPDYKPFYIQLEGDTLAKDTAAQWGLLAKANPFEPIPEAKEPYGDKYPFEDGDGEWVDALHYKPMDWDVEFFVKTYSGGTVDAAIILRTQMQNFFNSIRSGEFSVYDEYTGIGRQKVRYAGFSETSFRARDDWALSSFKITFRVNDPITKMTLSNGAIVEE